MDGQFLAGGEFGTPGPRGRDGPPGPKGPRGPDGKGFASSMFFNTGLLWQGLFETVCVQKISQYLNCCFECTRRPPYKV